MFGTRKLDGFCDGTQGHGLSTKLLKGYRLLELQGCGLKRWEKTWIGQPHLIKKSLRSWNRNLKAVENLQSYRMPGTPVKHII